MKAELRTPVLELEAPEVGVHEHALVMEVRDQKVEAPVAVDVLGVGGHGARRAPGRAERHPRLGSHVAEADPVEVLEEEVGRRVVRLVHVDPAVVVEVRGDHPHPFSDGSCDPRAPADVGEGAVTVVAVEDARLSLELRDPAHRVIVDHVARKALLVVGVELQVVRDEEVEPAVTVVVEERGAASPLAVVDSGPRGHVGERAVTVVVVEDARAVGRDVEIAVAVVVVVAHRQAHATTHPADAGLLRHVGEGSVAVIPVEGVGDGTAALALRRGRVGDEVDVEPAVAVVVDEPSAAPHGLDHVPAAKGELPDPPAQARRFRHVDELRVGFDAGVLPGREACADRGRGQNDECDGGDPGLTAHRGSRSCLVIVPPARRIGRGPDIRGTHRAAAGGASRAQRKPTRPSW